MAVKHEHIICVQQGDTIRLSGVSKNSSGAPINLTGATLEFLVTQPNAKLPGWSWNSTNDPTQASIPDPTAGQWLVVLTPADSQAWGAAEWLAWQARFTFSDGTVRTFAKGTFKVERELPDGG